jgi:hypothetical protein
VPPFTIASNDATVNGLLFTSLALVLMDGYLAMLIKSWIRDFDQSWKTLNDPKERARMREMRIQGLERWKLAWVVALLPLLIQASIVLFGVALLILLFNLHRPIAYSTTALFAAGLCFYFCTSLVSALDTNAPFTSPLSRALEPLLQQWYQFGVRVCGIIAGHLSHRSPAYVVWVLVVVVVVVVGVGVGVVWFGVGILVLVSVAVFITLYFNPISLMWHLVRIMGGVSPTRLIRRRFFDDVSDEDTADATVKFHPVEGAEIHCAISKRLYSATFKAVENFPVFVELFDQWVHTPSLRPLSASDWHQVLPLVQPYLLTAPPSEEFGPLPIARLLLCSDSGEFPSERETIIASLGKRSSDTTKSTPIEQMYIHLLRPSESDWSLAGQVVRELNADRDTIIELRWILSWINFRFLIRSKDIPNNHDLSWVSIMRDIIPFLRSTAVYIIQNGLVNDDHKLFNSLLLITRAVADASKEAGGSHPSQKSSDRGLLRSIGDHVVLSEKNHEGLFLSVGNHVVSSRWDFLRDLYDASSTSAAGFKREFTQLVILLLVGTLSTVADSTIHLQDPFIDTEKDLAILMDALWETWQAPGMNHHLLTGIAVWLLRRDRGYFDTPLPNTQQRIFQDLLNAYDSCTRGATPSMMTSNTLRFIEAALSFSRPGGDSKWVPQTLELSNPWLVMHIHNILRHDWRIERSAMGEAVHGQLGWLEQVKRLEWNTDGRRDTLDELDKLGARDALDALDVLDVLEWCEWREWLKWREGRERGKLREWLESREGLERVEWREWRKKPEGPEWEWREYHRSLERREWLEEGEWRELLEWRERPERLERRELHELHELHELREWDELRERLGLHEWREFREHRQTFPRLWDGWPERIKEWEWYGVSLRTQRRDLLGRCVWHKRRTQQSPAALEILARSQLNLYDAKVLRPDPLALSLFLSQRKKDIFNDSRRFILRFFGSTPNTPSLSPPDATEQVVDPATAREHCSDFFDSKAVGDVTKWRLLTSVVFPEWKTLSTLWKDLLAKEVMNVVWEDDRRVDWMARVTPLLAGTFNLYDFGLSENDPTYEPLSPTHLQMVATVVEYLGAQGLTYEKARGLEEFLEQHSNILCDHDALGRIWTVLTQVMQPDPIESLVVLFGDQT